MVSVFRCLCEWITGNSGVPFFQFICGYAPEIDWKTNSEDTSDLSNSNEGTALAMHKVAAMDEVVNLPLAGLESHCRHN